MTWRYFILSFAVLVIMTMSSLYAQDSTSEMPSTEKVMKGDIGFGGAYLVPHRKSAEGADDGGQVFVRLTDRDLPIPMLSIWLSGSFTFFGAHSKTVYVEFKDIYPEYIGEAERKTDDLVISLHLGPQLGSTSRRATFRPRVGIGLGINIYWTSSHYWALDPMFPEDEDLGEETDAVRLRGGWRFVAGVDVFRPNEFTDKLGVSLEITHERIWHRDFGDHCDRYWGFRFGLVFVIDKKQSAD